MSYTRAQVESMLVSRAGKRMTSVEFSTTVAGSNADLANPIATALVGMGITPANITNPSDTDLLAVDDISELMDRAELRLLQNIMGNLDAVDISVGPRRESYSQFGTALDKAIERLQAQIAALYGVGRGTLTAGNISLNFVSKGDDVVTT